MPLFGPRPDPQAEEHNRRSQEQMKRGGLPLSAETRLVKLREDNGLWTSNLSVNEFLLAREDGLTPLGQVMGLSVYHMGWQYTPTYASTELTALTHAQTEARRLALGRLQQEAAHLGAHGVVGVRLERGVSPGDNLTEWKAVGTAVTLKEGPPAPLMGNKPTPNPSLQGRGVGQDIPTPLPLREGTGVGSSTQSGVVGVGSSTQPGVVGVGSSTHGKEAGPAPWVSALSMQDFWTLRRAGYAPVGVAFGTCSFYCVASYGTQWATQGGIFGGGWRGNMELTDYTKAVYKARHLAMSRMEKEAARVGAEGVVGVTIDLHTRPYEVKVNDTERTDLIVHFAALGTAVTARRDRWPVIDYSLPLSG